MIFSKQCMLLALSSLAVLSVNYVDAFTPSTLAKSRHMQKLDFAATATKVETSDVSIPYDAAAKIAYDKWRKDFKKGDFDAKRFEIFKGNYEAITIANVVAAKEARDAAMARGASTAIITEEQMELNEYADLTLDEYERALGNSGASSSGLAREAQLGASAQAGASAALADASQALAEEERKLAEMLGLSSVEELEASIDAMEGIAEDGGELDSDNLAREARVRAAYIAWCKENNKKPDEKRYSIFETNYLAMEKYANESGTEMQLNAFADCTADEYSKLTGSQGTKTTESAPRFSLGSFKLPQINLPDIPNLSMGDLRVPAEQDMAKMEIFKKQREKAEERRKEAEIRFAQRMKEAEETRAKRERDMAEAATKAEKERKDRLAAQEKEAEKLRKEAEAAAIAAAKSEAEREAEQVARRRALQEEADRIEREKAQAVQSKLTQNAKIRAAETAKIMAKAREEAKAKADAAAAAKKAELEVKAKEQAVKRAAEAAKQKVTPSQPITREPSSVSRISESTQEVAPKKSEVKTQPIASSPVFSLFGRADQSTQSKPSASSSASVKKLPVEDSVSDEPKDPVTDALSSFFGIGKDKKGSPEPVPTPVTTQAKAEPKSSSPFFSFGSTPKAVSKPVESLPVSDTKKLDSFSLFGKPTPLKENIEKRIAPSPSPAKQQSFSFFKAPPTVPKSLPKKVAVPAPAPVQTAKSSFSFFQQGTAPQKASPPAPKKISPPAPSPSIKKPQPTFFSAPKKAQVVTKVPTPSPVKKSEPFSFFSSRPAPQPTPSKGSIPVKAAPKKPVTSSTFFKSPAPAPAKVQPVPVKRGSGTLSLFGFGRQSDDSDEKFERPGSVADSIPVLSDWEQNPDGSLTGKVTNSKNFRRNEVITTSPVRRGAKAGTIVRTASGSQYRLK